MGLNRQQKLQLVHDLDNENYFRKEVLIPLFLKMGTFIDVRDNHGANEKGTDIVLISKSPFGAYNYTSVIVKAQSINNASTGKDTAANVINQINLALNNGYNCIIQRSKVPFNSILVITNKDISGTAQETLNNLAQQNRISIEYKKDSHIVDWVDEYLPEFYFYRSGIHSELANAIRKKCEILSDLKNLPQFSVQQKNITDIFVQPQLLHLDKSNDQKKGKKIYKTPEKVINEERRVLIIGEQGSGKSLILREASLRILTSNTRDKTPTIPILLKASDISKIMSERPEDTTLTMIINEAVSSYYGINEFDVENLGKTNFVLLIDGLDEIVNDIDRKNLIFSISEYGRLHRNFKIVVTSRFTQDITSTSTLPEYDKWIIQPFSSPQIIAFLQKWFHGNEITIKRLLDALEDHHLLAKLPNTPLVLTLLAILFESDNNRELPANLSELYKMFLDLLLGRWALDRRVETLYDANIREFIAEELALEFHRSERTSMDKEEFFTLIQNCEKTLALPIDKNIIFNDFIEQTSLLICDDKEHISFRHLSFQEYLVAHHIYGSGNHISQSFLIEHAGDVWWSSVLYFYCGLRKKNADVLEALTEKFPSLNHGEKIFSIWNLGYLIQTSYLTDAKVRQKTIEQAIVNYYEAISVVSKNVVFGNNTIPEGYAFSVFTDLLLLHYSSRFLNKIYLDIINIIDNQNNNEETSYLTLAIALLLAEVGNVDYLTNAHAIIRSFPIQLLTLGIFTDGLLAADIPKGKKEEIKSLSKDIHKWFRKHPKFLEALTDKNKSKQTSNKNKAVPEIERSTRQNNQP